MSVDKKFRNNDSFRRALIIVALLNFTYFLIEFLSATRINSVSLFADSIDFLEDTLINLLIFFSFFFNSTFRAKISKILVFIIILPGLTALWTAWEQIVKTFSARGF